MLLRQKLSYTGHRASIFALSPADDASQFLSGGGDGYVIRWDFSSNEVAEAVAKLPTHLFSMCLLPSSRLVVGDMDGGIHWIENGQSIDLPAHSKGLFALCHDQNQLFTAGGDGRLTRWDITPPRRQESLGLSSLSIRCLAFIPEKKMLCAAGTDQSIYILDILDLSPLHILRQAHASSVFGLAWLPASQLLISGGRDAKLKVWDAGNGFKAVREIAAHRLTINAVALSPDHTMLATASRDRTIRLWDTATFELRQELQGHGASVNCLLWHPNGTLLSGGDDRMVIAWGEY